MKKNGFYGVGIEYGKNPINYGTLFRTAQILNADFIFIIGQRFKHQKTDVLHSYKHLPAYSYKDLDDFIEHLPHACQLIGIEKSPSAIQLKSFTHPKRAVYLLGAEDVGLSKEAVEHCNQLVALYGERYMNVSVAGSIVLYDRIQKRLID